MKLILFFSFLLKLLFLPDGFVYLKDIDDSIIVDLKYFTNSNFTAQKVDYYYSNNAILTEETAIALSRAQSQFKKLGYSLIVYDAYRPQSSVDFFVSWSKKQEDTLNKQLYYPNINKSDLFKLGYIAKKSGHSRGSTVDVSLVNISTKLEIDMGTIYDFFGVESSTFFSDISEIQKNNRYLLYDIMIKNGFKNYSKEWWHFTLIDEPYNEYYNFPVK
ncbi:MAG: peptidase M15 [Flavobacteriaceae bacterium]|nr:peptidase M15 [Flavobacteriaceae bacterium]